MINAVCSDTFLQTNQYKLRNVAVFADFPIQHGKLDRKEHEHHKQQA
ncbi:MAG: hypothetical protein LBL24_00355 [Bacteroidales bacterium]|nr:hypothetical protein [Bacteroidales bacterium]